MNKTDTINEFYTAFQQGDAERMTSLYHEMIIFTDPVFGELTSKQAGNMWRMLVTLSKGNLKLTFSDIREEDDGTVTAQWQAVYPFGPDRRMVTNKVQAHFTFREEKIILHVDDFSFYRWASMALGTPGMLLGWTPWLKNKVRKKSLKALQKYIENENKDV